MNLLKVFKEISIYLNSSIPKYSFKIIDVTKDDSFNISLTYQLCGKNITNTENIIQLIEALVKKSGFNPDNQKLLLELYQEQILSPTLVITKTIFEKDNIFIHLYNATDGTYNDINIDDLIKDDILKNALSRSDLEKIFQLASLSEQKKYIIAKNKLRSNKTAKLYRVK